MEQPQISGLLKAWRENEERRVKEARKTLEELDKDGK